MYLHVISNEKGMMSQVAQSFCMEEATMFVVLGAEVVPVVYRTGPRQISEDALAVADEIGCKHKAQNRDELAQLARLHHKDRSSHLPD